MNFFDTLLCGVPALCVALVVAVVELSRRLARVEAELRKWKDFFDPDEPDHH